MRRVLSVALLALSTALPTYAQQPAPVPPASPSAPVAPVAPAPPTPPTVAVEPPRNIRFDIVITDNGGTTPQVKTVTLAVATGGVGQLRSGGQVHPPGGPEPFIDRALDVDITRPSVLSDGRIRAPIVVQYQPYYEDRSELSATVRVASDSLLDDGKKTVVSVSADPLTDRKTTVEVTATIVR